MEELLKYWLPLSAVIASTVWLIRLEGKVYYQGVASKEHYETNKARLDQMDSNHNGLARIAQEIVTTLAEIKNDMKWIKESFNKK